MLSQLSWWPWIASAAFGFCWMIATVRGWLGNGTWIIVLLYAGGPAVTVLAGLLEAATTGVLVGSGVSDLLNVVVGLAITGIGSTIAGVMPVAYLKDRLDEKKASREGGKS